MLHLIKTKVKTIFDVTKFNYIKILDYVKFCDVVCKTR